ncbi:MAG TPA: hypothetical protein VJ732_00670 [Bryobacteraceae bacterium]|nr:hypothetical protein [Bryobacteraceae bacterium]
MPQYLLPGVYVQEAPPSVHPVPGILPSRLLRIAQLTANPQAREAELRIERAIRTELQWLRSAPNTPPTWAQAQLLVENALQGYWRMGVLFGSRPQEAFFVRCDRTTMTPADIQAGRCNLLVGLALLQPAQYVILRITAISG